MAAGTAHIAQSAPWTGRSSHASKPKRLAVLASCEGGDLLDLLGRCRGRGIDAEVALVLSDRCDLRPDVEAHGLPFHHVPYESERRPIAEIAMLDLLRGACDVVVLTGYLPVLSSTFLDLVGVPLVAYDPPALQSPVFGIR